MAVSQEQKVDFLLKKLGFTKTKTGLAVDSTLTGTKKAGFAEAIPSPLIIANSSVWNEADSIPATPPGSDTNQVRVYLAASSGHRMTVDSTVANNRAFIAFSTYNDTSSTRLNNWIDTQFGAGYLIKVFKGDPNSGGVQLSAAGSGQNDGWFFDYSAGVLNFNDTNVPSGVTGTNIYVVGYRYIGQTGAPTSGISTFSFLDLSVERNLDVGAQGGISTFRNNIDLNADLDVDGHTNLDNVNITGISTIFDLDVDGHTELDNLRVSGIATVQSNLHLPDASKLMMGDNNEFRIYHNESNSLNYIVAQNNGPLLLRSSNADMIHCSPQGAVTLKYDGGTRAATTSSGFDVSGTLNVTGISTFEGNVDINADLDVDGHTNLDNVSIAGVTTISNNLYFADSTQEADGANGNRIKFGNSDDFQLYYGGGNATIFKKDTGGSLQIRSQKVEIKNFQNNKTMAVFNASTDVRLTYNGNLKFNTTSTGINVNGNTTSTGNVIAVDGVFSGNVSIGGTLTYEDVKNVDSVGLITARSGIRVTGGVIEAQAGENKIPFLYANTSSLPDPSTYHGMFAHVHATQKGYFAHAGNWYELVNRELTGTVGTGTETYNIKHLNSVGISTFTTIDANGDLDVDGHTNLDNVSIAGVTTFSGNIGGTANFNNIDVDGHTELDNVNITGFTTFATGTRFYHHTPRIEMQGNSTATLSFVNNTTGTTTNDGMLMGFSSSSAGGFINVLESGHGFILKTGGSAVGNERINISGLGTVSLRYGTSEEMVTARPNGAVELYHNGIKRLETSSVGVSIPQDLDVDGHTNLDNVSISGVTTTVGDVNFTGTDYNAFWDESLSALRFNDNAAIRLGNTQDLQIYHSTAGGGNSYIDNSTGILFLRNTGTNGSQIQLLNNNSGFKIQALAGEQSILGVANGQVELYHNNSRKLATTGIGASVYGQLDTTDLNVTGVSTFTGDATFNGNITFGDATIDNVVFTGDVNSNIIPNTDNTYTLGTSSKRWAAIHVGLSTVGEDITTRNLDVSGIGTIGSGSSGQVFLQYQGTTKLTTQNWGTRTEGTVQALNGNLSIFKSHATNTGQLLLQNQTGDAFEIGHTNSNSFITGHVGNISINAPQVSISTNFSVAGVTTLSSNTVQGGQLQLNSTLKAGGTVGSNGYYLKSTGIGVTWSAFPTARTTQSFTASSGQTTFSFAYNVNYLDVFVNGTKLTTSEFTATNGTSVVLAVGCFVGDIVDLISYNVIASGGATGIDNIVEDVTPQLGGNLDLFNKTITGTGNINMTGVATATKFVGDGSGLTGIVASGSGVVVKDNGSAVGTAGTINFGTNLDVSNISAGIVTVTAAGITTANITSESITSESLRVTGVTTFVSKNVHLGNSSSGTTGRLTFGSGNPLKIFYDSNTQDAKITKSGGSGNLDIQTSSGSVDIITGTTNTAAKFTTGSVQLYQSNSVKLATTASGIDVTGTEVNDGMVCAGVGTFSGLINANANIKRATGNLDINASNIVLKNAADSATYASFNNGGNVELHFNNVKRFETTNTGAVVAGIMTATSFSGDGSNLTGISGSGLFSQTDVGIHTLSKVGIGTTNPTEVLHVSDGGNPFILIEDTNADNQVGVKFKTTLYNWVAGLHGGIDTFKISKSTAFGTNDFFSISNQGIVSIEKDLDVDGHTNLDNVNIAGIVTITNSASGTALKLIDSSNKQFGAGGGGGGTPFAGSITGHDFRIQVGGLQNAIFKYAAGATGNLELGPSSGIGITFNGSTGNAGYAGIVTAANFVGDGSGLTGIVGSGSGIVVQHDGSNIGTAGTINFSTNLDVSAISAGIVTVTASGGGGGTDVGITTNLSGTFTASAGTPSTINTFTGYSSDDLVVEYTIYIKNGSDFQTQKLLAMRDGTTIHSTQFAVMFSSSLLVQCDATISSGNILLRATPETGVSGSTTYKVKREVM